MKIAMIGDQHFGCRNDSKIFCEYFEKFYKNVFFPYLDDNKIDTIINLGDLLDRRKYVNFNTLSETKRIFIDELAKRKIDHHIITGNHDCYWKHSNRLNSIGQLFSDNVHIYDSPTEIEIDDVKFAMIPWINLENNADVMDFIKTTKAEICIGHFEFSGFEVIKGIQQEAGLDRSAVNKFDYVFSGHYHIKQEQGNIHYLGSPYEMTFSDYKDTKGFHIFDTETRNMEFIPNPYRMFFKIDYDDTGGEAPEFSEDIENAYVKLVVVDKSNPYLFDQFVEKINNMNPFSMNIIDQQCYDTDESTEKIDVSEDTLQIVADYVDGMTIEGDKSKIKKLIGRLYVEAQNEEVS